MKNIKLQRISSIYFCLFFVIISLSIGFSAYNTSVNINEITATIRTETDIRITNISVDSTTGDAFSNYEDYNVDLISSQIYLPNESSSVTYKVSVTNFESPEMGILEITGIPDELTYTLYNYTLKDKICNSNGECNLGISKDLYITIKYKDNASISTDIHNLNLTFNFQPFYSVNYYTDIEILSPICKPTDTITTGRIATSEFNVGEEYKCNVDDNNNYTFFILSEENERVNLILDRNIYYDEETDESGLTDSSHIGSVDWYEPEDSNSYGPVTAMNYLYNATKNWMNIPIIEMNYTDEGNTGSYGYGSIITTNGITTITKKDGQTITGSYENLRARLPYKSEVYVFDGTNLWMYNYLSPTTEGIVKGDGLINITGINAYWTLSSASTTSNFSHFVDFFGYVSYHVYSGGIGVRPVISIPKVSTNNDEYTKTIIGGDTLKIDFGVNYPPAIIVTENGIQITDYTYTNGLLEVPNVNGNIELTASY